MGTCYKHIPFTPDILWFLYSNIHWLQICSPSQEQKLMSPWSLACPWAKWSCFTCTQRDNISQISLIKDMEISCPCCGTSEIFSLLTSHHLQGGWVYRTLDYKLTCPFFPCFMNHPHFEKCLISHNIKSHSGVYPWATELMLMQITLKITGQLHLLFSKEERNVRVFCSASAVETINKQQKM